MNNNQVKQISILVLAPAHQHEQMKKLQEIWNKYFSVNVIIDVPNNITEYFKTPIDILFLWYKQEDAFQLEYYQIFQNNNEMFKYIVMKENLEPETDVQIYKRLVDDIVYLKDERLFEWKTVAILRRFWNTASKDTTIIYKGIIADFIDHKFIVDRIEVSLTQKEEKLLRIFMTNIGKFLNKRKLFKSIWGFEEDTTRVLDQIIFKLKKKIGKDLFYNSRTKGYKFE